MPSNSSPSIKSFSYVQIFPIQIKKNVLNKYKTHFKLKSEERLNIDLKGKIPLILSIYLIYEVSDKLNRLCCGSLSIYIITYLA